ncbi:MAG: amidohydrolase family protein [Candidatus Latescibacterota bacterium]
MALRTPVINGAEHAWNFSDPRFAYDDAVASCPGRPAPHDASGEYLIGEMERYGVDKTVISHVCYYGRNNAYTIHCVKTWPERFAGFGLLVGHRLFPPEDATNPDRLERLMREDGLAGLRLSPIYDPKRAWLNDPVSYPLWARAQDLGAVFNVFLAPGQVGQVADMAARFPGVKVVIDHLAMIDITAPDEAGFGPLVAMHRLPNVYIRTSLHNPSRHGVPYRDVWPFLERLYDAYGAARLIWANFLEYLIMKEMIPFFTPEDREWVLGKTAEGVYFGSSRR